MATIFRTIKHLFLTPIFTLALIFVGANVTASEDDIPKPFRGDTPNSALAIGYGDLTSVLDIAVFNVGRSMRERAKPLRASIGTRIKSTRNVFTALEGNRFHFKEFKDTGNVEILIKIQSSLEALPDEVALKMFSREEQLAYWLNLYNVTLLNELFKVYPKSTIGSLLYKKGALLDKKLLTVAGVSLSLNDIQYKILYPKYNFRPVIMYGLYQGYVGGPNIRTSSYTGDKVFAQLDSNAEEFINSNRGTHRSTKGRMRVSTLYQRNEVLFPDFEADLKKHLLRYVDADYEDYLKSTTSFKPNIKDMHISDIRAGTHSYGGSAANSKAAMLDSAGYNSGGGIGGAAGKGVGAVNPEYISEYLASETESLGLFDVNTVEILMKLRDNSRIRAGEVIIKEMKEPQKKEEGTL